MLSRFFVFRFLALGVCLSGVLALLGGCAASSSGASRGSGLETDQESCRRSCESDYARCGEAESARRSPLLGGSSDRIGGAAVCQQSLKSCLPRCKGR